MRSDPPIDHQLALAGLTLARAADAAAVHAALVEQVRALMPRADVEFSVAVGSSGVGAALANPDAHRQGRVGQVAWHVQARAAAPDGEGGARPAADVLALLVQQASVGLQRLAEQAALDRHEQTQAGLVEAGKALTSERTLDGVLEQVVRLAMRLTGARYGALGVLEDGSRDLARFVTAGIDEELRARIGELPRGRGILGVLIDDPRPLRLARLQDDPRSVGFPPHHPPMTTFLGVPIITKGSVAGRIYLTEKHGGLPFSEADEQVAETLASQAAIAIDNASLNERLQETAAALEEASRHKSTFLANMSHELRSPLNTIIGYTRLLQEDPRALDPEQLEDLAIVRGSGEHLLALITDLLDLQRVEAGRVALVLAEERLATILRSVAAAVQPSVPEGVELQLALDALRDDRLRCDATRVRQVLLNVVGNALKFTTSGHVRIEASDDPDDPEWIRVSVSDTGPGIPQADQARIFESFYQSTGALERTPGPREGAGLGLAITKLLVQLHGGDVTLRSAEGEGTQVTIRLPRGGPGEEART